MPRHLVGNHELTAAMVGSAVEHQPYILPGEPSRQDVEEDLKACRVGCRHDQVDDITVFNHEVLFNGTDAAGKAGLWLTNGTAAGTHELAGISGASTGGLILPT
jgi:hypothetical protein